MTDDVGQQFKKGVRVHLSPEGRRLYRFTSARRGEIVGGARMSGCVAVLWDGRKTRETVATAFLEVEA